MKKTIVLFGIMIALSACAPLQPLNNAQMGNQASSQWQWSSASWTPPPPAELEGEFVEAPAVVSGTLNESLEEAGMLVLGGSGSVRITIFTNYGCAYCNEFSTDMLPKLLSDFVAQGKLDIGIMVVPLKKYPNSSLEAAALLCAAAHGKGLAMHEVLTDAKTRDRKSLQSMAKTLGMTVKEFTKCLDSKETKNLLADQQAFINEHAVTLIPAFILNEEKRVGLPLYADLRGWIKEQLAR